MIEKFPIRMGFIRRKKKGGWLEKKMWNETVLSSFFSSWMSFIKDAPNQLYYSIFCLKDS